MPKVIYRNIPIPKTITYGVMVLLLILAFAPSVKPIFASTTPVYLSVESPYDMRTTAYNLIEAAEANNFQFIREQAADDGFADRQSSKHRVLYFCNFALAHQAVELDKRVGFTLPFRVSLSQIGDKVYIYYLNPERLQKYMSRQLSATSALVEKTFANIVDESTL